MKLTDIITAQDIYAWVKFQAQRTHGNAQDLAFEIFPHMTPELEEIRELLVKFGAERGQTGANLQFLDEAIQFKSKQPTQ